MWDASAKRLAIKVIAAVESDYKYDAIYYSDPITVGIAQWYGTRAASLLLEMRSHEYWSRIDSDLRADLERVPTDNSSFWTTRYLDRTEGRSLSPILLANKSIQDNRLIEDLEGYARVARRLNLSPDSETRQFIYWCQLYHQSPKYSKQVLTNAGDGATLDRMHAIAQNHRWYGRFKSRLREAYTIIKSGNNVIPGGGGSQIDDDIEDNDDGQSEGHHILYSRLVGGDVHIQTRSGTLICRQTGTGLYYPVAGSARDLPPQTPPGHGGSGTPTTPGPRPSNPGGTVPVPPPTAPPPSVPGNAGAARKRSAVVKWMTSRLYKFRYSQGAGRMNSDRSGVGDCSSTITQAYRSIGITVRGGYTEGICRSHRADIMYTNFPSHGARKTSLGRGHGWLLPGDLIFNSSDLRRARHVEMYVGNGRTVGHGGPGKGPDYSTTKYHMNRRGLCVIRIIK